MLYNVKLHVKIFVCG